MITEDFISVEIQQLLNKKGFDFLSDSVQAIGKFDIKHNDDGTAEVERCCTHQMAMKWLREIHDKNIIFNMIPKGNDCYVLWTFNILANKNYKIIWGTKQPKYKSYEEAVEAAIKYCLENLI